MFTGIIQEVGQVRDIKKRPMSSELEIVSAFSSLHLGESISVDGVCLTVTKILPQGFLCEASPETLHLTVISQYQEATKVNLERSLKLGDQMGGHWVSGHVDGLAELVQKEVLNGFWKMTFRFCEKKWADYFFSKASVALNGVSLTVNQVFDDGLEVMLIPHTLEKTNLKLLELGSQVNVEVDWMSKLIVSTVHRVMEAKNGF